MSCLKLIANESMLLLVSYVVAVYFPDVTTHCGCIFHSPVAGFSLLVFEVS
jgi:hypothetical protein